MKAASRCASPVFCTAAQSHSAPSCAPPCSSSQLQTSVGLATLTAKTSASFIVPSPWGRGPSLISYLEYSIILMQCQVPRMGNIQPAWLCYNGAMGKRKEHGPEQFEIRYALRLPRDLYDDLTAL